MKYVESDWDCSELRNKEKKNGFVYMYSKVIKLMDDNNQIIKVYVKYRNEFVTDDMSKHLYERTDEELPSGGNISHDIYRNFYKYNYFRVFKMNMNDKVCDAVFTLDDDKTCLLYGDELLNKYYKKVEV